MDIGIGKLIKYTEQRDAIHIAVAPVVAGCTLQPGQAIRFAGEGQTETVIAHLKPIGIVDPFLKSPVKEGQRFWMFLMPGSITSLRHDWTHPAFEAEKVDGDKLAARKWLEEFAGRQRHSFETLSEILENACSTGRAWCGDDSNSDDFNSEKHAIMQHWAIFTGKTALDVDNIYFSCAC